MAEAAKAFDENNSRNILHRPPRLVRESGEDYDCPWTKIREGEMPPMMFQVRFNDGRIASYAYSDIREVHCRDAGHVQLMVFAMQKLAITFEGRHLRDLANLFCNAAVRSVDESDPRDLDRPESAPEVVRVSVDPIEEST